MPVVAQIDQVTIDVILDNDPDVSYLQQDYNDVPEAEREEYLRQDAQRLERYEAGDWCLVGMRAVADISFVFPVGMQLIGTEIKSGGLWGIESDSTAEYVQEVADDMLAELRSLLSALGFTTEAIDAAFATADRTALSESFPEARKAS